jgi:hypothetical protein
MCDTVTGERFEVVPLRFKFWLLEPNVGIGLWPNYTAREEVHWIARHGAEAAELG